MRRIPPPPGAAWLKLTKGRWALVDAVDFAAVSQLSWHLYTPSKAGGKRKRRTRYARAVHSYWQPVTGDPNTHEKKRRSIYLHRWLWEHWGLSPAEHIDHDGGDGLDCRRSKLRAATHAENQRARAYKNSLGLKGIRRIGSRYIARITVDGARRTLGRFETAERAAAAYDSAARELHGDFAWTNAAGTV